MDLCTPQVTLRKRLPNPYIPLFLNGTLVWGSPPTVSQPPPLAPSDAAAVAAASGAKKAPNPSPPSGSSSYPLGSSCQTDSTGAQVGVDRRLSLLARAGMQHIDGTEMRCWGISGWTVAIRSLTSEQWLVLLNGSEFTRKNM